MVNGATCIAAPSHERVLNMPPKSALEKRVDLLEEKLEALQTKPKKSRQILVHKAGICGRDPEIDSAHCEKASLYSYQSGCLGLACSSKNREYYREYRSKMKGDVEQDT